MKELVSTSTSKGGGDSGDGRSEPVLLDRPVFCRYPIFLGLGSLSNLSVSVGKNDSEIIGQGK